MGQTLAKPALRPYLPSDAQIVSAIYAASIEELTGDDYSEAQQLAWIASNEDEAKFAARLGGQLTLIATINSSPVGFASLRGTDQIDLLYVHPAASRQGVATLLCTALEKLAGARGATNVSVDASDSASEFFSKRGYVAMQRNSLTVGDEWLANTTMKKALAATPGDAT